MLGIGPVSADAKVAATSKPVKPFDYTSHYNAATPALVEGNVFLGLSVEPDYTDRTAWVYFNHTTFVNGNELWLEMVGIEAGLNVRVPVWVQPNANIILGMAMNNLSAYAPISVAGSIFFKSPHHADYWPVHPFQLPTIKCRQVNLVGKFAAGNIAALLAIRSLPPK